MNASGTTDDFFEDGLYYLKRSIQLLAEDSSRQYAELSKHGLLDEFCDEVMSGEHLLLGSEFSNEIRSIFASITTRLRKICSALLEERVQALDLENFETMEWQELRSLSKEMLLSLDMLAKDSRVDFTPTE